MEELKCPICGKILKVVQIKSSLSEIKKLTIHCNRCNTDIEFEV